MKIAIHNRPGSFSDRWIPYCEEHKIPFKIVNCYDSDIIDQLKDCDGLMWHWSHNNYRDQNFARQLIISLEIMGKKVFPNSNTCWHFDDKVGQKYLLEAIGAPLVETSVFHNERDALNWTEKTSFPKVFKLRGGAGSKNVMLVQTKSKAKQLIIRAFNKGFPLNNKKSGFTDRLWVLQRDKGFKSIVHVFKGLGRLAFPRKELTLLQRQKGYVYFQDFIPGNDFDDRVVIIGNRAIAIRRCNRKNDFRASGSGLIYHNPELFPKETIETAFRVAKKIDSQSMAFDFVYDQNGNPLIVEVSYAFHMKGGTNMCLGYWDNKLDWHSDQVNPQKYMIEDFVKAINDNIQ